MMDTDILAALGVATPEEAIAEIRWLQEQALGAICERYIARQLEAAGFSATLMPRGHRGFDINATRGEQTVRIEVKALQAGAGRRAGWWNFRPEGWDWLALVRKHEDGRWGYYLLPHDAALAISVASGRPTHRSIYWDKGPRGRQAVTIRSIAAACADDFTLSGRGGLAAVEAAHGLSSQPVSVS